MKNLIRLAVSGVLITGVSALHAQNLPSTGNSDLWLFVSDQSAGTTFAEDTGISLSSLLPTGSLSSGATLSTAITDSLNLPATAALTAYITSNGASNLEWAVDGIQFPGTTSGTGYKKAGGIVGITDNTGVPGNTSELQLANLQSWGQGLQGDLTYLTSATSGSGGYTAGGSVYKFSNGGTAGNVWGSTGPGTQAGSTNLYGQGPDQSGLGLGSSAALYGLTGNGGTGQVQSYVLASTLELTSGGVLETVSSGGGSPVPIPAALWLFGSGLLGLAGVGRRRAVEA